MTRWHRDEVERSWPYTPQGRGDAKNGGKGNGGVVYL